MPDETTSIPTGGATTPPTVQSQVQDIFSDTDSLSASPHLASPTPANGTSYNPYASSSQSGMSRKTMILIVGAIVALLGIIGAGFLIFTFINNTSETTSTAPTTPAPTTMQQPTPTPPAPSETNQPVVTPEPSLPTESQPVTPPTPADRDADGLTDDEELSIGTNLDLPDTDNDGLTDREEVKVYNTNSMNADTDADGYLDGQEVRGGYNPNGLGTLYQIQQ